MELRSIHDLRPADTQAVIINVGTKLVTTLALMGALRHASLPVLLIDCESRDGSYAHFAELMRALPFDLLSAPLRSHGRTLDWLFTHIPADNVLLVDSDLEIRAPALIDLMRACLADPRAFGSGFVHDGGWMTAQRQPFGYYVERMWVPLTLLRVGPVRGALGEGLSFAARMLYNDFPPSQRLSRLLVKRFRIPGLRRARLGWLDPLRRQLHGVRPAFFHYDTGADIYQHLRHRRQGRFMGLPWRLSERYVTHFHGVTRLQLNRRDRNGAQLGEIAGQVAQRLRDQYGVAVEG